MKKCDLKNGHLIFVTPSVIDGRACAQKAIITPRKKFDIWCDGINTRFNVTNWDRDVNGHVLHQLEVCQVDGLPLYSILTVEAHILGFYQVGFESFRTLCELKKRAKELYN